MKVTKIVYKNGHTKDGYLQSNQGRIVIYGNKLVFSKGNSQDHLYILRSLAAKYGLNKDEVISNAIRLYFAIEGDMLIVSQNRKIDEDYLMKDIKFYGNLILQSFR